MKYWELIADNLSKTGWGCVSAVDSNGRTIWIADSHRDDGKRFVVHADEKLTAFLKLEAAIRADGGPYTLSKPSGRILCCKRSSRAATACSAVRRGGYWTPC
jgi:hypothetical protein